jgi:hypothetical protein
MSSRRGGSILLIPLLVLGAAFPAAAGETVVLPGDNLEELAERALAAEQERFQIGTSSTFVLIRLQTDLASARVRQLLVLNEYRKAIVEYARQGGLTLVERRIQVSDLLQE